MSTADINKAYKYPNPITLCSELNPLNYYYYNNRLWPFLRDYPGELVPEETITHSYLSQSSINLYQLPPSTAIHSILPIQFSRLTVFFAQPLSKFSLVYLLSWHPPLHTYTHTQPFYCSSGICPGPPG